MKLFSALALAGMVTGVATAADADSILKTDKDKASYSIGMDIGRNFKQKGVEINPEALLIGLKDSMAGGKTLITEAEARQALENLAKEMGAKQQAKNAIDAEKNKKDGAAFLAANKTKEGVKTTASGLQYKVIKTGTGKKPAASDTVTTHYKGTLIDGTEFDSSYSRNEPAVFPVNHVIPGWTEALQLMTVGSKWQLWVPSELAYGEQAMGGVIGPNSTLIFEVELLSIGDKSGPQEK